MPYGPCRLCGATNYPNSYGGPFICPSCDAGNPPMKAKQVSFEALVEAASKFVSGKDIFEALAEMPGTPIPGIDYEEKLREVAKKAHEFAEWKGIKDQETVFDLAAFLQKWFMEGVALGRQEALGTLPTEPEPETALPEPT